MVTSSPTIEQVRHLNKQRHAHSAFEPIAEQARRARAAQTRWATTPIRMRLRIIKRVRALIANRSDSLVDAIGDRYGRTPAETLTAEIIPLADACRFLEREAASLLKPRRIGRRGRPLWLFGTRGEVHREPLGVVLILAPGNYRLLLAGVQMLQALTAGNAVLLKPPPGGGAPLARLRELLIEAGLPANLVQILADGRATGEAALAADIDHVVLTGSAATGRSVLAALAPRLIPATLELSGDDAVFVLQGADLDRVADSVIWGLTLNAGATCIAPRRVYVTRGQHAALAERLAARLADHAALPADADAYRRALDAIDAALAAGYRHLGPVPDAAATTMPPVVMNHAGPSPEPLPCDLFAPIASLVAVADMDAALVEDARCGYALGAAIFGPEASAHDLARRINAGVVTVNDLIVPTADPRAAFGGRGQSGYGVTRGAEGLLALTRPKTVLSRRGRSRPHLEIETRYDRDLFSAFLRLSHGRQIRVRLRAIAGVVAALRRRSQ